MNGRSIISKLFAISVLCVSAGCTSILEEGALIGAQKEMKKGRYDLALNKLSQAEHSKTPALVMAAEITFLRAECYERMGRVAEARGAYSFTVESFPDTAYGRMAQERLKEMELSSEPGGPASVAVP